MMVQQAALSITASSIRLLDIIICHVYVCNYKYHLGTDWLCYV